jgi:hypothetical protein
MPLFMLDLPNLLINKRASGRPKDLDDLRALHGKSSQESVEDLRRLADAHAEEEGHVVGGLLELIEEQLHGFDGGHTGESAA